MTEPTSENTITSNYPDYTDLEKPFLDPNLYKVPKVDAFMEMSWWFETPVIEVDCPRDDS